MCTPSLDRLAIYEHDPAPVDFVGAAATKCNKEF
ncbi:hypothetical protein Natoc_0698 [Natronococcus occultus SP4]|uniref:Uncharacterized protein n=1 Tax=Natronococcus occultus SP4 TaxID=694430 RepID=L0JXG7_9EURY|nr:hypothetical protein Natoc_0698 [Natronococcus occultus SP4]